MQQLRAPSIRQQAVSALSSPGERMALRCLSAAITILCLLSAFPVPAQVQGQAKPESPPAAQPGYTFQAESRVVLTDVTVTDRQGHPVRGLPRSAFHIFDNNQPQTISSFEEHVTTPAAIAAPAAATPGFYSNDFLLHLPPVLNVIVLDITNISIPDQMYLNYELTRFLKNQPPGQPLAIYLGTGTGCFLLQNFTSDQGLLLAAVHKAIPRFPPPGREYVSDIETLHEIAFNLSQLPGRKNLLWFSGGSTLFLSGDGETPLFVQAEVQDQDAWREIYDELEQERIAVYPIDARGLMNAGGLGLQALWSQQSAMQDVARATGGHAFYNNNGLTEIVNQLVDSDGSFYTITYSPKSFRQDKKWHKVKVSLEDSSYTLSYRTGYFADAFARGAQQPEKPGKRSLLGGGEVEEAGLRDAPIIFQARVLPASDPALASLPPATAALAPPPPKKGTVPFAIRYSLPLDAFSLQTVDGKQTVDFGVAAFSFGHAGAAGARIADQIRMSLNPESLRLHPNGSIIVQQQVNLAKGDDFLSLVVWDKASHRLGTLQITLNVPKPAKPNHGN
jgi:VWFA-related protein